MSQVLIVYATQYGNTKKMAEKMLEGARSVKGCEGVLKTAEEAKSEDVLNCDALVLGSPVHMGSPDWRMKSFIDKVCSKIWMEDKMIGKVGAVFATGGGYGSAGGGGELTMLAMMNNLVELGLIIIPLPKNTPGYAQAGLQWGPYGRTMGVNMEQTGITDENMKTAYYHGANVARAAAVLKGQKIFVNEPIPV